MNLILTGADAFATIGSFLAPSPLAVCNLTCLAWENNHTAVDTEYFTTSISLLRYARKNGCDWNEDTCRWAAQNGNLSCLKYLHEHKCPWDKDTCVGAAQNGHLACLKYLHESQCSWDWYTCALAAQNAHLEC